MGIRVQPKQLDIPDDDPFKNDLLGRKESAEVFTGLIGNMEGPCVLAVDAAWGTGKTTFINMWAQHLRNNGFKVVNLNAWETDFTGDPFLAISSEITDQLKDPANQSLTDKVLGTRSAAVEVAKRAAPGVIRVVTAGILDIAPLIEKEIGQALGSFAEDRLSRFKESQESLADFRESLDSLAQEVAESCDGRPLVIVIDELDRCRPLYAVELLEVAKHLFSVDHVFFVLAVNRAELAHSIKAIYGEGFGAEGYLDRFFDIDIQLPVVERKQLIEYTIEVLGFQEYFDRTNDAAGRREFHNVANLLTAFLDSPGLSLRTIEQSLNRLGLLFASLRSDVQAFGVAATVTLILRTHDSSLFQRFINKDLDDIELADTLFARAGIDQLRRQHVGELLEAYIILAGLELRGVRNYRRFSESSPLWRHYVEELNNLELKTSLTEYEHSISSLKQIIENLYSNSQPFGIGFETAIRRLELLSNDFL
jgi:hypothetical protein